MAVYTEITYDAITTFLSQYNLGELYSYTPIQHGIANSNYFIRTSKASYVLTLFEMSGIERISYQLTLLNYLAVYDYPCPRVMRDKYGQQLQYFTNRFAVIAESLPGEMPDLKSPHEKLTEKLPSTIQCRAIGKALGLFHRFSAHFPRYLENEQGDHWLSKLIPKIVLHTIDAHNTALLKDEFNFQQNQDYSALPQGACHKDVKLNNLLFVNDDISGVLDFWNASSEALAYDVACCTALCCSSKEAINVQHSQILLEAYQTQRPFNTSERTAWPGLLRRACLVKWVSKLRYHLFHLPTQIPQSQTEIVKLQRLLNNFEIPSTMKVLCYFPANDVLGFQQLFDQFASQLGCYQQLLIKQRDDPEYYKQILLHYRTIASDFRL